MTDKKRKLRTIRFNDDEWGAVQKAAKKIEKPVSTVIRRGAITLSENILGDQKLNFDKKDTTQLLSKSQPPGFMQIIRRRKA